MKSDDYDPKKGNDLTVKQPPTKKEPTKEKIIQEAEEALDGLFDDSYSHGPPVIGIMMAIIIMLVLIMVTLMFILPLLDVALGAGQSSSGYQTPRYSLEVMKIR